MAIVKLYRAPGIFGYGVKMRFEFDGLERCRLGPQESAFILLEDRPYVFSSCLTNVKNLTAKSLISAKIRFALYL